MKADILAQVVLWVHNDAAAARGEEFWELARNAIAGDVYGVDFTVTDWDLAHCVPHGALWFYACLGAAHVYLRDEAGAQAAGVLYRDEVGRVGTGPALRGVSGRMEKPYGA